MDQAPSSPLTRDYDGGISAVDARLVREEMAASFLMVDGGRAAFVEAGTARATDGLLAALDARGVARENVDWVIVTHAHLDHAGGAWRLLEAVPNATLVAHPRAAPHLIDPEKLIKGATAVYGEAEFKRQFDRLEPVPESRVQIADEGDAIELDGRPLYFMDTPGHANHHFCVWDETTRGWFTGDTFGLSYREFDTDQGPFFFPTTTPIDFDPKAMHDSIERMLAFDPRCVYLTHYGRVDEPAAMAPALHRRVDEIAALAERHRDAGEDRPGRIHADMEAWLLDELAAHGVKLPVERQRELLAMDLELNAQGLEVWLKRREKNA